MRSIEDVGSDLLHFHEAIQYVGIFKNDDKTICKYFKSREGELEAQSEDLADGAKSRLYARLSLSHNLGKPRCSFTQYEKAIRLTFYYGDYMILMKIKPIEDYNRLINKIGKKLKEQEPFMYEKND
ncbi:hypothetical protein [Nitrosopumilus ureiphilus]|uniref:Uncharacterized protein n=1 Tax=Nitrosopumilus ureiphilus TaxID=1470067 RepID=A0A7D5REB7_9ARCH|nr:hypothetical protein [Nitrosopumilus ureiphilus]QLH07361.1 hypothetical protein C5F50_09980 [Nitrosopumilus ureiphilus]